MRNKVEIKSQNYEKCGFMKISHIVRYKVPIFDVAIMKFYEIKSVMRNRLYLQL